MQTTLNDSFLGATLDAITDWTVWSHASRDTDLPYSPSLDYVDSLLEGEPDVLNFPQEWFIGSSDPTYMSAEAAEVLTKMSAFLGSLGGAVSVIDPSDKAKYCLDIGDNSPDFFESHILRNDFPELSASPLDSAFSCQQVLSIILYDGLEDLASICLSSQFLKLPGCQLLFRPSLDFPWSSRTAHPSHPLDFTLINDTFSTFFDPYAEDVVKVNPETVPLLVGMKAGEAWSPLLSSHTPLRRQNTLDERLREMALHVEPSIQSMLIACRLSDTASGTVTGDASVASFQLPPWAIIFGLIYDSQRVCVVAHIPYAKEGPSGGVLPYSCVSYVARTYTFSAYPASSSDVDAVIQDRLRLAVLLRRLRKHCFRLTTLFDNLMWPPEIQMTINPEPSNRGGPSSCYEPEDDDEGWYDGWIEDSESILERFWRSGRLKAVREWVETATWSHEASDDNILLYF